MEDVAIFELLRRHLRLIVAISMVAVLVGYGLSFLITERYDATAIVLVRPHEPIKVEEGSNSSKEFSDFPVGQMAAVETASKTYMQIIGSSALVGEVVRELKLDQEPPEPRGDSLLARTFAPLRIAVSDIRDCLNDVVAIVKYGRLLKDDSFTKAVKHVTKNLGLKSDEDTYIFEIHYSDKKPQTAAAVANTAARLFITFMEKMRSSEAQYSSDHLRSELEQSRKRLVSAQQDLENYKALHKVFLYKQEYDAKLKVISSLEIEIAKLDENLAASPGTLAAETYAAQRARLLEILDRRRAALAVMPTIERELQVRQADVEVAATTYDTIAKDLKEAEIKRSDPVPAARLISPATIPRLPSHPRRLLIALISLAGGLVVSVILAFFQEYINQQVHGVYDVENLIGLKVIGTIPALPAEALQELASR